MTSHSLLRIVGGHQCRHQSEGGGPFDHERGLVEDERQDEGLVRGQAEGDARSRRPELGRPIGRGRSFWRLAWVPPARWAAGCVLERKHSFWWPAVLPVRTTIHFGGWLCCRPLADAGDGRVGRWPELELGI